MKSNLSIIEQNVLSLIPRGKANRKTLQVISGAIDLTPREIQSVINTLITNHHIPIVAIRKGGVYIPLSEDERVDGLQGLKNQTSDQLKRIAIVESIDLDSWPSRVYGGVANE
ncbi:hypothetical protein P7H42_03720 [Vagococcus lutrae]|uniref:hypothetical protein n=1 Tax=Vagococcus lutrae TaxID=81947 RepID=UPI00209718E5|nr:hypothetical protein [Vagococcus lutrae]MCO7150477.1 hypothetical protein [Vagococcus lutrae]MDT2818878.1 hypothetical protein [Vagococcus lutrae]MDT2843555.1 hypothetical protein [Vagococcus lutrae]WCG04442.1 hypothetical protein PML89_05515 [Vagococcus lutrae]